MSEFCSNLEDVQRLYLDYYRTCIEAHRDKDSFVAELLILVNGPPEVPKKYRLWRCDGIWKSDGQPKPVEFQLNPPEAAPAVIEFRNGIEVTLFPILWHSCEFQFQASNPSWQSLDQWQQKWIDEGDKQKRDEWGLAGVIHWMSQPAQDGSKYVFNVDFGSAPPNAFHELVTALGEAGGHDLVVRCALS